MHSFVIRVITLNPDAEATKTLVDSIRATGFSVECFAAIDGRSTLPELQADESIDQRDSLKRRLITLTNTEIACYLSHLRAIKQAHVEGVEHLCLFEDDISLEEEFASVINKVIALPEEFELVRLMGLKRHKYKVIDQLAEKYKLVRPVKGLCGAQGYVLNRKGMEKIIKHGSCIREPIDKFYDHFWEIDLRCYAIIPHVIWERPHQSSIKKESLMAAVKSNGNGLRKHWYKVVRSVHRKVYLLMRFFEFWPTKKSKGYVGRTTRMR